MKFTTWFKKTFGKKHETDKHIKEIWNRMRPAQIKYEELKMEYEIAMQNYYETMAARKAWDFYELKGVARSHRKGSDR